jgi:peptidyl-prolyl cis-trans isomerase B (cyclophilin B)
MLAIGVALAVALGGGGFAAAAFLTGSSTPVASTSGSPSPTVPPGGVACGGTAPPAAATVSEFNGKYPRAPAMTIDAKRTYVATMRTSCGVITIELDARAAPNTVNSIVFLARHRFFDGSTFQRIVPNFVVQGGDPTGTGSGGPGYTTVDKPPANARYPAGTVAMAKTGSDPAGTAGGQFFIVTSATAQSALAPGGVGQYAIVGHVTSGMGVVQKIAAVPVGGANGDTPQQKVYIERVTVSVR